MLTKDEKEMLREVVLEVLSARHPAALTLAGIARRASIEVDFQVSEEDAHGAVQLLSGLGLANREVDPLGSTPYWRASSAGVLAVERRLQ